MLKLSQVIIGGDSAGGQLCLAILSVILHGFPGVDPLKLDRPLAGALLISPWVSYNTDGSSWKENKDKDIVPAECLHILTKAYIDPNDHNNYSEPHQADVSWWRNAPAKSILNVYGGYECFRDDIADVGKLLKEAGNDVKNVECPKEVHIDCVLDAQAEFEPGEMSKEIWQWLASVF
jgi:acetyl esterase/lipase